MIRMIKHLTLLLILFAAFITPAAGQLVVTDTLPTFQLIQTLFGNGVQISNLTVQCDTLLSLAQFDATNTNLGLGQGVLLSSGEAADATGPNSSSGTTGAQGRPGYNPLSALAGQPTFDACVIQFDIVALCDSIGIRYVFASEEYNEYVNSINDVFAFFISGPGIAATAPGMNIALVPGTPLPVSINNVNNGNSPGGVPPTGPCTNCVYFQDNTNGATVQYDAFTVPLVARAAVQACQTYHVTLAIADAADGILDSGVFLEAGGIGCITPTLQLSAVNSTILGSNVAVEGCVNTGQFIFTLPQPLADSTTFTYTVGGTAQVGLDYAPFPFSFVMPAGQTSYTLPISIFSDGLTEGTEFIEIYYADSSLCLDSIYRDTAVMVIWDAPIIPDLQDTAVCSASPATIGFAPQPNQTYQWLPDPALSSSIVSNPTLTLYNTNGTTPDTSTFYLVTTAFQGFCLWIDSMQAVVYPAQFASAAADTVCFGTPTSFTSSTTFSQLTAWGWAFGDGTFDTTANPVHIYPQDGPFQAIMVVQNALGCLDTVLFPVLVDSLPIASFMVDPVCQEATSIFVNDVRPGTTYAWSFGDGNTSTLPSPTHVYDTFGIYPVTLVATSAQGCVDSMQTDAIVYQIPAPSFTAENECFREPIRFINTTKPGSNASLNYTWNLGDGTGSSLFSPQHVYTVYGVKNVSLTVTDAFGCTNNFSGSVRVYALPEAAYTPDSVCTLDALQLRSSTTVADGSAITRYNWLSGDGRTSSSQNPSFIYNEEGFYTVSLEVETEFGCKDTISHVIASYPLPEAIFDVSPVCALDSAVFVTRSQVPNPILGDRIVSWTWDFADGSSVGSLDRALHPYAADGLYNVSLTVVTDKGCRDVTTRNLLIYPLPEAPEAVNDTACFGDQTFLMALPGEHTEIVHWYESVDALTPFRTANSFVTPPVTFPVTYFLEPVSDKGCIGTRVPVTSEVYEAGDWELRLSAYEVELPDAQVRYEVLGTREVIDYAWSFGDGTTSSEATPVHTYDHEGRFEVVVTYRDVNGCEHRLTDALNVKKVVTAYIPSAFTPNGDGTNDVFYLRTHNLSSMTFKVFNRWGQQVFEANSPDFAWSGTGADGRLLMEGVYSYVLQAVDFQGQEVQETGTITLIR
ncbi:MAG: PKD domain-containing protein [Bacteroidia bacterium]|nr:PKD domain-containing protein [Bacteroidia bacterium]